MPPLSAIGDGVTDFLSRSAYIPMLGLLLSVVVTIYPLADFDTFWHVANGRAMAEQGRIVNEEVLSYTAFGTSFSNHAWLAQMLFYGAAAAFGFIGLTLLKGLICAAIIGFTYGTLRLYRIAPLAASLYCLWLSYTSVYLLTLRPNLFSLLFIAMVFFILEGVRLQRLQYRTLWWLPVIFLLWHFMHGAIYGLALLGAYTAAHLVLELRQVNWRVQALIRLPLMRHYAAVVILVLLAVTLNPTGSLEFEIFSMLSNPNYMVSVTGEFLPTPWLWAFAPFWISLGVCAVILILALVRRDLISIAILLPFAYLAIRYSRATVPFVLLAVPVCARYLNELAISRINSTRRLAVLRQSGLIVMLLAALFTVHYKFLAPTHVNSFGWGLNPEFHPEAALKFLDANQVTGNLFNAGELGGYIAYAAPQRKIFIYNHATVFNELLESLRYPGALDRWHIDYAILGYNWQRYQHLFPMDQWAPVYYEQATLVMVRRSANNRALISEHEIQVFSPLRTGQQNRDLARDPRVYPRLMQEIAAYLQYREDREIADIFADLIQLAHPGLTAPYRQAFIDKALQGNPKNDNLLQARRLLS